LGQNYPNPFNPSTKIEFALPKAGYVTIVVYDVKVSEVTKIAEGNFSKGTHQAVFDAGKLSSGVYFYTLKTESFTATKKMLLVK
jgi:hypothetical protein